jgi:hypothetical protein
MIKILKYLLAISLILTSSCAKQTFYPYYSQKGENIKNISKIDAIPVINVNFTHLSGGELVPNRIFWTWEAALIDNIKSDISTVFTNEAGAKKVNLDLIISNYLTNPSFSYMLLCWPYYIFSVIGAPIYISNFRTEINLKIYEEGMTELLYKNDIQRNKSIAVGLYYNLPSPNRKGTNYKPKFGEPLNYAMSELKKEILEKKDSIENHLYASEKDILNITNEIEIYVNEEINKWQVRGKYENSLDYQERVTPINRQKNIDKITKIKINNVASKKINIAIRKSEYDPDNEVFKLTIRSLPPIFVKVSTKNNEASSFEDNISSLKFSDTEFTLTKEGFALLSANITNPTNGKTYIYNYQDNLAFGKSIVEIDYAPVSIKVGEYKTNVEELGKQFKMENDILIDYNIPKIGKPKPNAFAVIIGNSNYEKTSSVKYAIKDAQTIKKYLINVFGFMVGNIFYKENANKGFFEEMFGSQNDYRGRLYNNIKIPSNSEIFVYYSGHGAPGLRDKKGYFVPVESDPLYVELTGYSQELLINNLAKLQVKSITLVFDACFSGADILDNVSSIFPEVTDPIYKIEDGVMISASKANQVSTWYDEMQHGLFTYFFLKGLKEAANSDKNKDGLLTYEELFEYISNNSEGVPYFARKLHNVEQNPTIQGNIKNQILIIH